MPLIGNALIAHDANYAIGTALQNLINALNTGISQLDTAGATDSKAKAQALKDAMAPFQQAVLDSDQSYLEAGNLNS